MHLQFLRLQRPMYKSFLSKVISVVHREGKNAHPSLHTETALVQRIVLKERMLGQHQKLGDGVGDDLVIERPDCSATSRDC